MTERKVPRSPVTWRLTPRTMLAGTAVTAVAVGGLLSAQVATGRDPALAAIALRAAQHAPAAAAPAPRRVIVRRVIITRVVTTPPASSARAVPATGPAPAPQAVATPVATPAPAPAAAAPAPPPPVVSRAS